MMQLSLVWCLQTSNHHHALIIIT